jgi:hypothetical protein
MIDIALRLEGRLIITYLSRRVFQIFFLQFLSIFLGQIWVFKFLLQPLTQLGNNFRLETQGLVTNRHLGTLHVLSTIMVVLVLSLLLR